LAGVVALAGASCIQRTGGEHFSFTASAAGPSDVPGDGTLGFTTSIGWQVVLTRARMHIGGVYLNAAVPISGARETSCFLQGIYDAQLTTGVDVDLLSATLQPFPEPGEAIEARVRTGEVWLAGGAIDASDDPTIIADLAGTATRAGMTVPFEASVTIGQNRALPVSNPATPGANPICKQRIVSPIPIDLPITSGGSLVVRIDPRPWFATLDFGQLEKVSDSPPLYRIPDTRDSTPGTILLDGIQSRASVYTFDWRQP
jgi:hypothetical protein